MRNTYLCHHGIKDQKWGIRRYRNEDGTLTDEGKKRYGKGTSFDVETTLKTRNQAKQHVVGDGYSTTGKKYKELQKKLYDDALNKEIKKQAADDYKKDFQESTNKLSTAKNITNDAQNINRNAKDIASKTYNPKVPRMDLSKMTNKEMQDAINREYLERNYNDMFNPEASKVKKGKANIEKIFDVGGDILGIAGGALSIALAIKMLKG